MTPPVVVTITPVAVDRSTAASMLAMSVDSLERYVLPDVRLVRQGRLRLVPVSELVRWCEENAEFTLEAA
jgi:hypothetical protein